MIDTIRKRYFTDPVFHSVVDCLRSVLVTARLAPSEVREAAMLACIINEEEFRLPLRWDTETDDWRPNE